MHQIAKAEQILQSLHLEFVLDRGNRFNDAQMSADAVTVAI